MSNFFILFLLACLFACIVFEIVTLSCQKLYHYIKGSGVLFLQKELSDCRLNTLSSDIIGLSGNSELDGSYIALTKTSIIFPYYISSNNKLDYGILIFSKSYFLVRNKFKELKPLKNKRLKFN